MDKNEQKKQQYNDYVEQITPKHNLLKNMLCAFLVGGLDLRPGTGDFKYLRKFRGSIKTLREAGVPCFSCF